MLHPSQLHRRPSEPLAPCLALVHSVAKGQAANDDRIEPRVAMVLGTEIRTQDAEEMRRLILRALTDRFATERRVEIAPAEIDACVGHLSRLAEKERGKRQARLTEIDQRLASPGLSAIERKTLTAEIDALSQLQRDLDARLGGDAEETPQVKRRVAAVFIRQWEIDRALYEQYGGRIGSRQCGPEPLDAHRKFLLAQHKKGAFHIINEDFEAEFWRYYIRDAIHSFLPPGSKEEKQAFQTPWWH